MSYEPVNTDIETETLSAIATDEYKLCVIGAEAYVSQADRRVAEAEVCLADAKAMLKAREQEWQRSVRELRDVVCGREQPMLPYPKPDAEAEPDAWRDTPIEMLDRLSETICLRLREHALKSIGDIADYTAEGKLLTDLAGIGQAKAEVIEDALTKYWEDHPRSEAEGERAEVEDGGEDNDSGNDPNGD